MIKDMVMERKNGEQRFIVGDEDVFISFDGENGLVIQTKMATYRSYYSLLGWELLGPACQLIEVKVKRQGQPTLFERVATVSRDWRKK